MVQIHLKWLFKLDKELILYLNKTETIEAYEEVDPVILSVISSEEAKYEFI